MPTKKFPTLLKSLALFLIVVILAMPTTPLIDASGSAEAAVRGSRSFNPVQTCPAGFVQGKAGSCIREVKIHWQASLSLDAANEICRKNGWALATADDVQTAWRELALHVYAFGRLRDGSFAVPVQSDFPNFKRGANLGAQGGNQGFFYVLAASLQTQNPAPASRIAGATIASPSNPVPVVTEPAPSSSISEASFFEPTYCQKGVKNFMVDGWDTPFRPLLEDAGRIWLEKKKRSAYSNAMAELVTDLKSESGAVTRWEFAPLMLRITWQALAAVNPTPAQRAFQSYFNEYAACDAWKLDRITLALWNRHIGAANDLTGGLQVGNQESSIATLNTLVDTGKTTEGFLPLDNPLFLGSKGEAAISLIYKPLLADTTPGYDDRENLRALEPEITKTAVQIGVGSGSAILISGTGVGAYIHSAIRAGRVLAAREDVAAKAGADIVDGLIAQGYSREAAEARVAAHFAKKAGSEISEEAAERTAKLAAEKLVKVLGRNISARALSSAGGIVLSGVAFFASVFGEFLAQYVKTKEYDAALRKGAERATPFDVSEYLNSSPAEQEGRRARVFTQLVKMTIADPADAGRLTMRLPDFPCRTGDVREKAQGYCVRDVKFHSQAGLTKAQADEIALQNGWQLATNSEVLEAWELLGLNVYAFGMLNDGRFAVPVQSDHSNFKRGANIDARGGNQGFFYVLKDISFHSETGLTLDQARTISGNLGGRLATPDEVRVAWEKQGINVFAYAMTADGKFAVPLQADNSSFKRGPNIGVSGGNQGFLWVRLATESLAESDRYRRGGETVLTCEPGTVYDAGLCYTPCPSGYKQVATRCYPACPIGFRDDGLYCGKPEAYNRDAYLWRPGDPPLPNYSGPMGRCEEKFGKGGCEQVGAEIFGKCRANFHAVGPRVCSPDCPAGLTDVGASCAKPFVERGVGKPVGSCPTGSERAGALCYPLCKKGFEGVLDWCYKRSDN